MPLGYEGAWLMPERSCADVPAGVKSLSHKRRGLLAQLVEQLTLNQLVAGSNPSQPTTPSCAALRLLSQSLLSIPTACSGF